MTRVPTLDGIRRLQRYPHDLGGIDNPGLHHVLVLARLCVKPEIRAVVVGQLADHDRALDRGILGDLTYRRLDGLVRDCPLRCTTGGQPASSDQDKGTRFGSSVGGAVVGQGAGS